MDALAEVPLNQKPTDMKSLLPTRTRHLKKTICVLKQCILRATAAPLLGNLVSTHLMGMKLLPMSASVDSNRYPVTARNGHFPPTQDLALFVASHSSSYCQDASDGCQAHFVTS